jgi:hypothetical protein
VSGTLNAVPLSDRPIGEITNIPIPFVNTTTHLLSEDRSYLEALDFGTYNSCLWLFGWGFGIFIACDAMALAEHPLAYKSCCTKRGFLLASWHGGAFLLGV